MSTTPQQPAHQSDQSHPYFGQGGSYQFDPATGQTTLIERAGTPLPDPAPQDSGQTLFNQE